MEPMTYYVVHTKPFSEWQAHVNLLSQSYESFLPYKIQTVTHARRVRGEIRGYFPGYLFVGLTPERSLRPVGHTPGVSSVVYLGGAPLTIPPQVISELKSRCSSDGLVIDDRRKPAPSLKVGQVVKIVEGAFAGFLAEIARIDGSDSVAVWINILGGKAKALVPVSGIAA